MRKISELEQERLEWSIETFTDATPISALRKLEEEIKEVEELLNEDRTAERQRKIAEEYADCLMCLFDSAGRAFITPDRIFIAFEAKLQKNKCRAWKKNPDNTYSHIKDEI